MRIEPILVENTLEMRLQERRTVTVENSQPNDVGVICNRTIIAHNSQANDAVATYKWIWPPIGIITRPSVPLCSRWYKAEHLLWSPTGGEDSSSLRRRVPTRSINLDGCHEERSIKEYKMGWGKMLTEIDTP